MSTPRYGLSLALDDDEVVALRVEAAKLKQSVSAFTTQILREYLRTKGSENGTDR